MEPFASVCAREMVPQSGIASARIRMAAFIMQILPVDRIISLSKFIAKDMLQERYGGAGPKPLRVQQVKRQAEENKAPLPIHPYAVDHPYVNVAVRLGEPVRTG